MSDKRVYEFMVYDPPTPMGRKRGRVNTGKLTVYPEQKDLRSVYHIRQSFREVFGESASLIAGPVVMSFRLWHRCPSTWSMKKRKAAWMKPVVTTKPDINNVLNQICDALTGYAYVDDKLVTGLRDCWKFYAVDREGYDQPPRMLICVEEL